jgi:hypothetical protein
VDEILGFVMQLQDLPERQLRAGHRVQLVMSGVRGRRQPQPALVPLVRLVELSTGFGHEGHFHAEHEYRVLTLGHLVVVADGERVSDGLFDGPEGPAVQVA